MDPLQKSRIGKTSLYVPRLGLGGAGLAGLYKPADESESKSTIRAALNKGAAYCDTAPLYGYGQSERFYGSVLKDYDRDSFVISTKVGKVVGSSDGARTGPTLPPETTLSKKAGMPAGITMSFDFSRDGVLRSIEDSLERLQLDRVDICLIHDPDAYPAGPEAGYRLAVTEVYPTLAELRSQGVIKAVGAGMNQCEMLTRFAHDVEMDCFLLAGRYTLIDHSAVSELLPVCQEKGISIILGGPFNSGILASDLKSGAKFNYRDASEEILNKARRVKAVCERFRVPMKAAALQYVFRHPSVATTVPGARMPEEFEENFQLMQYPIPEQLWESMKEEELIP